MVSQADETTAAQKPERSDAIIQAEIVEASRQLIARGSKSFSSAAQFFDRQTRTSVYLLYAWCRHCDDAIDGQELGFRPTLPDASPELKRAQLAALEAETTKSIAGTATDPIFIGLGHVLNRHHIAARFPHELLDGLRMDVEGRRYQTLEDLLEYCYCVAGTVGVMMAKIMGVRALPDLQRACDLGIAFQLTNIARDVISDHEANRVYLPAAWLAEHGLTPANLAQPHNRAHLAAVVARLLETAQPYYRSANTGLPALSFRSAWAVATARSVYGAIGDEVRKAGPKAWDKRMSVGTARKLIGVVEGLGGALATRVSGPLQRSPERIGLWTPPALSPVAASSGLAEGSERAANPQRLQGMTLSWPNE
jgi:15-cis-phytoene synthase